MTKDIDASYRITLLDAENGDDLQTFKDLKIISLIDSPGAFHESLVNILPRLKAGEDVKSLLRGMLAL